MSFVADEFDMSFFQGKPVDHGFLSPLSMLGDANGPWPGQIVPLQAWRFAVPYSQCKTNVWNQARHCVVQERVTEKDLNVAIMATGGLSHQVHGETSGLSMNETWDTVVSEICWRRSRKFLRTRRLADYAVKAGIEGAEVIMWLIMRGALSEAKLTWLHKQTYAPSDDKYCDTGFR
jgi:gallate dioxygenase